jgi:hypothetical protein
MGTAGSDDIRRKLKRRADELGIDLQAAVQYYAMDRQIRVQASGRAVPQ